MKILALMVAVEAFATCGFALGGNETLAEGSAEAAASLVKAIPIGTPLATARAHLESLGFTCAPERYRPFEANVAARWYVHCDQGSPRAGTKRWQVELFYAEDKVSAVQAVYGTNGR